MVAPSMVSIGPLVFHLYGLILGIATVVVIKLITVFAKKNAIIVPQLDVYVWTALISAVIGARAWHVMSDWRLYQAASVLKVVSVWNGGVSIFGAVTGLCVGIVLVHALQKKFLSIKTAQLPKIFQLLDLLAISLPMGQAIGRFGNFVNQELYGLPTGLPWAITIDRQHRVAPYLDFSTFHPLFAYESIAMIGLFAFFIWKNKSIEKKTWQVGSGRYFFLYICFYSIFRFFLDFLRIDAAPAGIWGLSVNQVVLVFICLVLFVVLWLDRKRGVPRW